MSDLKPPSQNRPGLRPARCRTAIVRRSEPSPTSIILNSSSANIVNPNHLFAANPAAQSGDPIEFSCDIKRPCPDRLPIVLLGPINFACPQLRFWNIALSLANPSRLSAPLDRRQDHNCEPGFRRTPCADGRRSGGPAKCTTRHRNCFASADRADRGADPAGRRRRSGCRRSRANPRHAPATRHRAVARRPARAAGRGGRRRIHLSPTSRARIRRSWLRNVAAIIAHRARARLRHHPCAWPRAGLERIYRGQADRRALRDQLVQGLPRAECAASASTTA